MEVPSVFKIYSFIIDIHQNNIKKRKTKWNALMFHNTMT